MLCIAFLICSFFVNGKSEMLVFGHRGASFDAPENTLAAVKKAFKLGADGVEVDVQMTADKKVVVLHDDTLKRTATYTRELKEKTGMSRQQFDVIVNTPICQLCYDEFKYIDIGLWKGKNWSQEKVPTLDEILRIVLMPEKLNRKIQIEIKGGNLAIVPELKKILSQYSKKVLAQSVIFIGFDFEVMSVAKKEMPDCRVLLLREFKQVPMLQDIIQCIDRVAIAELDGVGFEAAQALVTQKIVGYAHQKNKLIGVWVYSEQDTIQNLKYLQSLGIDFMTTNLPPEIVSCISVYF